jgi:hypothetical protein
VRHRCQECFWVFWLDGVSYCFEKRARELVDKSGRPRPQLTLAMREQEKKCGTPARWFKVEIETEAQTVEDLANRPKIWAPHLGKGHRSNSHRAPPYKAS